MEQQAQLRDGINRASVIYDFMYLSAHVSSVTLYVANYHFFFVARNRFTNPYHESMLQFSIFFVSVYLGVGVDDVKLLCCLMFPSMLIENRPDVLCIFMLVRFFGIIEEKYET